MATGAVTRTPAGFFIGGPVIGALAAVAANYGSKRDNEAGQAVRAIASNAIEAFNFLMTINTKYDVTGEWRRRRVAGEGMSGDVRVFDHKVLSYRAGRGRGM